MNKKRKFKYKEAFRVACKLLNGDVLNGVDKDIIFQEVMEKDDVFTSFDYEEYILKNIDKLRG